MKKYYKILGLNIGASVEEIENRYKELLSEFDPTKHADDLKDFYQKERDKVQEAYQEISLSLKNTENFEEETPSINSKNNDSDSISEKTKDEINDNKLDTKNTIENIVADEAMASENISSPPIYNTIKKESQVFRNVLLFLIASGVWGLFMQNMGLFVPSDDYTQKVRVVNTVDTEVTNSVRVNGSVDVNNTVGIDIKAINGYYSVFWDSGSKHKGEYYRLPVYTY